MKRRAHFSFVCTCGLAFYRQRRWIFLRDFLLATVALTLR